jgi:hypothetical protein
MSKTKEKVRSSKKPQTKDSASDELLRKIIERISETREKEELNKEKMGKLLREAQEKDGHWIVVSPDWDPNPDILGPVVKGTEDQKFVAETIKQLLLTKKGEEFDSKNLNKLVLHAQSWKSIPKSSARINKAKS